MRKEQPRENPPLSTGRGSTAYPPSNGKIAYSPGESYRQSFSAPYRGKEARSPQRGAAQVRRPRKRIIFPLAIILGITLGACVAYFSTPSGQSILRTTKGIVTRHVSLYDAFQGRTQVNVLLIGLDSVRGDHPGEKPDHRSDSMIVASTDFDTDQIRMVSIPRDSWVPHYCDGRLIDEHQKLGHTYAEGGVACTKETIEHLLNVPLDYYVVINFEGFQKVIDAIGGIDIDVKEKMDYDDNWGNLHIHLKKGLQHMDGKTAMGYARFRHDLTGDIGRMGRQQEVLKTMMEKMKSSAYISQLPRLFQVFHQNVETNMSIDQLLALAQNFDKFSGDGMRTMTVENYGPYDGPAYPWGRHSFEGRSMAQYLPESGIEAARQFLMDLSSPPPATEQAQQPDAADKGWTQASQPAPGTS